MGKPVTMLLVLVMVCGLVSLAVATDATKSKDSEIKPQQGSCYGDATTFVNGLGQKEHIFWYSASGTDWYFDPNPTQRYYTGGAGVQCGCPGNAQDECTVDVLSYSNLNTVKPTFGGSCTYGQLNPPANIYGTVEAVGDWTGLWISVEWHAMCYDSGL